MPGSLPSVNKFNDFGLADRSQAGARVAESAGARSAWVEAPGRAAGDMAERVKRRRILVVSAPFGPFFRDLASALEAEGAQVWRLCFEGGDVVETPARNRIVVPRGKDFRAFVSHVLRERRIDAVLSFNDILPRNRVALDVAESLDIERFVLENGYLRPHWVTLERDGVNGHSGVSRDPEFYRARARRASLAGSASQPRPAHVFAYRLRSHVLNTIGHFVAAVAASPVLGFDPEYYGESIWSQAKGYLREFAWRQFNDEVVERASIERARADGRRVFTVLLQKPGDGQIMVHSRYRGNNTFLREVVTSFARSAPADAFLVVKQHPLDFGNEGKPAFAAALFDELGLKDRAVYLRMTSIEICMDNADGLVTINSTGGLHALQKGLAVKCMGEAVYDVPGLTFQGALDDFWAQGTPPEAELLDSYVDHLMTSSQLNGGFHTREARALLVPQMARRLVSAAHVTQEAARVSAARRAMQGVAGFVTAGFVAGASDATVLGFSLLAWF